MEKTVKNLVIAHALNGAVVLGQPGGFAVLVKYGANERAVAAQRSRRMRIWRNLNTAAAYVRNELGLERFEIDMSEHDRRYGTEAARHSRTSAQTA